MLALIYITISLFFLILVRINDPYFRVAYNPFIVIWCVYTLYTFAPTFFSANSSEFEIYYSNFLMIQIIGLLGIGFGSLSVALSNYKCKKIEPERKLIGNVNLHILIAISIFLALSSYHFGSLYNVLMSGYSALIGHEHTDGDLFANLFLFYLFPTFMLLIGTLSRFNKIWYIGSFVYCTVLVLLGTRNTMLMYIGSSIILMSIVSGARLSYKKIIAIFIMGMPFALFLAVYRNQGAENIIQYLDNIDLFDFEALGLNGGEFLTSFNVFTISEKSSGWWQGGVFGSYISMIFSIVPRILWVDRPLAISNIFSNIFAPPGEGLGFSVNTEAYVSIGLSGVLFINYIIGIVWSVIYRLTCTTKSLYWSVIYSTVPFFAFNINRIDLQTVFKMSLIQIVFAMIVIVIFTKKR